MYPSINSTLWQLNTVSCNRERLLHRPPQLLTDCWSLPLRPNPSPHRREQHLAALPLAVTAVAHPPLQQEPFLSVT